MRISRFEQGKQLGNAEARALYNIEITNLKEKVKKLAEEKSTREINAQLQILESLARIAEAASKALLGYNKQL